MDKARVGWRWLLVIIAHVAVLYAVIQLGDNFSYGVSSAAFSSSYDFGGAFSAWREQFATATTNYLYWACGISLGIFIIWNILYEIPDINHNASRYVKVLAPITIAVFLVAEAALMIVFVNKERLPSSLYSFFFIAYAFAVPFLISLLFLSPYVIKNPTKWFRG